MYAPVRLRKLKADGTAYISWNCYRLPDHDGFVRLFVPRGTPRLHAKGSWTPEGVSIAAIHPELPYVVHWWRSETRGGFYVDAARSVDVRADTVSYVDLYLDLAYEGQDWLLLDEDELAAASEEDARHARDAIEQVRNLIASGSSLFDEGGDMWRVPPDAMKLEPRAVERLD
jgi:Protein of unknown function (DUF402)